MIRGGRVNSLSEWDRWPLYERFSDRPLLRYGYPEWHLPRTVPDAGIETPGTALKARVLAVLDALRTRGGKPALSDCSSSA